MEWRNWGLCSKSHTSLGICPAKLRSSATQIRFSQTLLQKHLLFWCNAFRRLDLSNLVARTEYHSRLVLSTPYFEIFKNFFVVKYFLPEFCTLPRQTRQRLCKIHSFPLAIRKKNCYYINARFCGRAFCFVHGLRSWAASVGRCGFCNPAAQTDPPPESRQ